MWPQRSAVWVDPIRAKAAAWRSRNDEEGDRQVTGPSGTLAERVGDHVASADRLLLQSSQVVERVRARVQQTHGRVERTLWRVQEAAGEVRAVQRSTTGAVERFLQIKQRELAAHLAAVELHEQAAELQEQMGHSDRADYQARIAAIQNKADSGRHGDRSKPAWRERSGSPQTGRVLPAAGGRARNPARSQTSVAAPSLPGRAGCAGLSVADS